jgi:hypothetical protein
MYVKKRERERERERMTRSTARKKEGRGRGRERERERMERSTARKKEGRDRERERECSLCSERQSVTEFSFVFFNVLRHVREKGVWICVFFNYLYEQSTYLVPNHHMNIKWVSEKKLLSIESPSAKHDQINYPIPPPPLGFMTKRCVLNTINISCFI